MDHHKLFINGEFVDSAGSDVFETIDPGTGFAFATVARAGKADAEAAIAAARRAFDSGIWSNLSPAERADKVYDFADEVSKLTLEFAMTEAQDAGHVLKLSKFWGMMGAGLLRNLGYYAKHHFPWEEEIRCSGNAFAPAREMIWREPIGVCVGIVPWNFPASSAFWKIAQAITMGNTIVLKPASSTPLTALIIARAALAAGIPPGVINVLPGPGAELGRILCTHPDVDKIAVTGSTEVGREIMKMAADSVKKVTLELGGKSANIILDDADIDLAASGACFGTFFHQGQVCESGTRVLVSAKIYEEFIEKMKKRAEEIRVGYQLFPDSHMGPLANAAHLATVESYVKLGREEGATLLTGGKRVEIPGLEGGYYYAPTIFTDVKNSMRIAQEEIFGPVVCVIKCESDEEAVAIANDSIYGLAGGVFSGSNARAMRIARQIRTGTLWINNYHAFGDFCPFGGYKQSGVGRELGAAGLEEYTQVKRVHVNSYASVENNIMMQCISDETRIAAAQYNCPTNVISGHGTLPSLYKEMVNLGCRKAFIISDRDAEMKGAVKRVEDALVEFCAGVYDQIGQEATLNGVDEATDAARQAGADCIVSVGNKAAIDTAKVVCVTLKVGGKANDHIALQRLQETQIPHIAIPTPAGGGSEVTKVAVLRSERAGRHVFLMDNRIVPNTAILDPLFVNMNPGEIIASAVMDALTNTIEAMTSVMAHPVGDGQALQAIRLLWECLPAVMEGRDEKAQNRMQCALAMAGSAYSVAEAGLARAMSRTLAMIYRVDQSAVCGILLPAVMRFNADRAADKLESVALALGVNTAGMDKKASALAAADAVEKIMKTSRYPLRLRELGIPEDGLDIAAFHAICDPSALFNARPVNDPGEIAALYRQVF